MFDILHIRPRIERDMVDGLKGFSKHLKRKEN